MLAPIAADGAESSKYFAPSFCFKYVKNYTAGRLILILVPSPITLLI